MWLPYSSPKYKNCVRLTYNGWSVPGQWPIPLGYAPARNCGTCIHLSKYLVQDDEYNYNESLQAYLMESIVHYREISSFV